jgi:hypothetical protein
MARNRRFKLWPGSVTGHVTAWYMGDYTGHRWMMGTTDEGDATGSTSIGDATGDPHYRGCRGRRAAAPSDHAVARRHHTNVTIVCFERAFCMLSRLCSIWQGRAGASPAKTRPTSSRTLRQTGASLPRPAPPTNTPPQPAPARPSPPYNLSTTAP